MESLIKWIGSKVKYLDVILPLVPDGYARYFEPFVGGGSLFMGMPDCRQFVVNDDCLPLMELYREAARPTRLFTSHVKDIAASWRNLAELFREKKQPLVELYDRFPEDRDYSYMEYVEALNPLLAEISYHKVFPQHYTEEELFEMEKRYWFTQMKTKSEDHTFRTQMQLEEYVLTSLKAGLYSYYADLYNSGESLPSELKKALLLFLLYFSTNGQFVFDSEGEFRPVYAGTGHNMKSVETKLDQFRSPEFKARMEKSELHCLDFRDFFRRYAIKKGDFLMVDPPLGVMCRKVGEKIFSEKDLEDLLAILRKCKAKWMLLLKESDLNRQVSEFAEDYNMVFAGTRQELIVIRNYE